MEDITAGQFAPASFTELDDPAFLAERARVRGLLEYEPENSVERTELERVYAAMTEEFCHRAAIAWRQATSNPGGPMSDDAHATGDRTHSYGVPVPTDEVRDAVELTRRARLALDTLAGGSTEQQGNHGGWMDNQARTRLLAVEVLLADPEALGNDALEGDLYILRDKLRAGEETRRAS
jgi:hypothetical protein